jgi:hypothetical protein
MPSLYLKEGDDTGGGLDPLLLDLPALLSTNAPTARSAGVSLDHAGSTLDRAAVRASLRSAGLRMRSWTFRVPLTQEAYAAWLKIPPVSDGLFADLNPSERARRIDAALDLVDRRSWKWECWSGWTAWRDITATR